MDCPVLFLAGGLIVKIVIPEFLLGGFFYICDGTIRFLKSVFGYPLLF